MRVSFFILLLFFLLDFGIAQDSYDIPLVVIEVNGGFSIPDHPETMIGPGKTYGIAICSQIQI